MGQILKSDTDKSIISRQGEYQTAARGFFLTCIFSSALIGALSLFSTNALATITVGTVTGASSTYTAPGQTTPTYYFSNIDSSITGTDANGVIYYKENALGTSCTNGTLLNPNCKTINNQLVVPYANSATGPVQMYMIAANRAFTSTDQTATVPLGNNQVSTVNWPGTQSFTATFGAICAAAGGAGNTVTTVTGTTCASNVALPRGPVQIYINIIADVDGSSTYNAGDDIASFPLFIQSTIPVTSSLPTAADSLLLGIYDFVAFPGDSEVHIRTINTDKTFPAELSGKIQSVRMYYSISGFNGLGPLSQSTYADFSVVDAAGNLNKQYISGLTNGTTYFFRASLVDAAGNIGYLSATDNPTSAHSATPDEIAGLLAKNGQCFVATAAFGSPMAKQVEILRKFRGRYLMTSDSGRKFVSWYYKHGPKYAAMIKDKEGAKQAVRFMLYPFIGFSWLSLQWGMAYAFTFLCTLLLLPLLIIRWKQT